MTIKNRNRAMTQNLEWKTNGSKIIAIPQDNLIRRISMHIAVNVATGTTAGTGIKNGGLLNLIKRIQVRLNGHDGIFDVDLKTYYKALTYEYGTKPFIDTFAIPAANTSKTFNVEIPIDFAIIRNQISDYTALVPAQLLDSMELIVDYGSVDDLLTTKQNTTITDASSEITLSLIEVYSTTGGKEIDDIISGLTKIYEGVEQTEIDSAHLSYPADELPVQVRPVPARHLAALIVGLNNITDGNPIADNAVISQLKIDNVKGGGESLFHEYFVRLQRSQKLDYRLESDNFSGVVYMDYVDLRNGSLVNVNVDAIKYKFLVTAPTTNKKNAIRIYKKYIPVAQ